MTAPTVWLSPVFNGQQFLDNNGFPLNGGLIYTYEAGSFTVQQTTYTDDTGSTANSNPLILNSAGRLSNPIWLDSTKSYNLVLCTNGNVQLTNEDNVTGVPVLVNSGSTNLIWNIVGASPTFVSTTQFLVPGSYSTQFAVGNRVQILNSTSAYQYATVTAVTYSGGNTQVTVANDSTVLSVLMTQVSWSDAVASGPIVDAGGVSYTSALSYSNPKTVGGQISSLNTGLSTANTNITNNTNSINTINSTISSSIDPIVTNANTTWVTGGTSTAFTLSPSPPYTGAHTPGYMVYFNQASGSSPTMNVSGTGAYPLVMRDGSGTSYTPSFGAGTLATITFDGNWVFTGSPSPTGIGQTWYNMTGSRSLGVSYTNNYQLNKTIEVVIGVYGSSGNPSATVYVNGVNIGQATSEYGHISNVSFSFSVPYGQTYEAIVSSGGGTFIVHWAELR